MYITLLNIDDKPLHLITLKKAFSLERRKKVISASDKCINISTIDGPITIPSKLKLIEYHQHLFKPKRTPFSRRRVFHRDSYTCCYCGKKIKDKPTIDHIIPKSKGGRTDYLNVVTSCTKCNFKKGDKTLKESGMELKYVPYEPKDTFLSLKK